MESKIKDKINILIENEKLKSGKFKYANLAQYMGISPQHLYNIKIGKNKPSLAHIRKICQFFNVDISFFLDKEEEIQMKLGEVQVQSEQPEQSNNNLIERKKIEMDESDLITLSSILGKRLSRGNKGLETLYNRLINAMLLQSISEIKANALANLIE